MNSQHLLLQTAMIRAACFPCLIWFNLIFSFFLLLLLKWRALPTHVDNVYYILSSGKLSLQVISLPLFVEEIFLQIRTSQNWNTQKDEPNSRRKADTHRRSSFEGLIPLPQSVIQQSFGGQSVNGTIITLQSPFLFFFQTTNFILNEGQIFSLFV